MVTKKSIIFLSLFSRLTKHAPNCYFDLQNILKGLYKILSLNKKNYIIKTHISIIENLSKTRLCNNFKLVKEILYEILCNL